MKKKDHLMLASFILTLASSSVLALHSAAFTAGCIEPDLNVFTYLRGSRKEKKFHGHNAGNCRTHLEKLLGKIEERGLTSGYDCFLLGVAVHYIADSFTAVHNTDMLDVDVKGACNIKHLYGGRALSVFIQPPSIGELRRRLERRGTDAPEVIERRLAKAAYELEFASKFDHVVVNNDLAEAEAETLQIVSQFLRL